MASLGHNELKAVNFMKTSILELFDLRAHKCLWNIPQVWLCSRFYQSWEKCLMSQAHICKYQEHFFHFHFIVSGSALSGLTWSRGLKHSISFHLISFCDLQSFSINFNSSLPGQNGPFSQTIFSDAFSWMIFWLRFHLSLFLRVQLTITQHWFR